MTRRMTLPALVAMLCSLLFLGIAQAGSPSRIAVFQASPEAATCADPTIEEATLLVMAYLDVFSTGDVSVFDQILSPDIVHHWGVGEDAVGIDAQKAQVAAFAAAFNDMTVTDFQIIVADDGYVTARWAATLRQVEPLGAIAPADVETTHTGINIFRIECGLIVESWNESDHLGRLIQSGVITEDELASVGTPTP